MPAQVYPTVKQRAMTSTEIATRIAVICTEAISPNANRDALLFEMRQLQAIQCERRKKILEVACY